MAQAAVNKLPIKNIEMSKENLFRGKRKDNNEWCYGSHVSAPALPFNDRKDFIVVFVGVESGDPVFDWYEVYSDSVGMYIRTSQLGENIYIGDILEEDPACKSRFEVVWDATYSKFKLDCSRVCDHVQYPEWNRGGKMKIIGNIFDNPELLNG